MANIIGLSKPIESEATGTVPTHHVLVRYFVDLISGLTVATFGCYMSGAAKAPVDAIEVRMQGAPEGVQAIYQAVLAMSEGVFVQAVPVYEEPAA